MSDNVAITAGSGTSVRTKDISGNHQQVVTLADDAGNFLAKLEDAAHSSGDPGVQILAVRKDTASALAGTDGDYIPLITDGSGRLWVHSAHLATLAGAVSGNEMQVDVVASLPAGTNAIGKLAANSGVDIGDVDILSVIPGTGATNLGKAVDSAGGSTDTGVATLAIRDDALSSLTPAEGDYVRLRVNATGALWVHSADLSTLAGVVSGSEMQVDVVAALPAGTNAIGKLAANDGVDIGDVSVNNTPSVTGDVAHDSADSGSPLKIGAVARTANPSAVSDGDRVNLGADDLGRLIVTPNQVRDLVAQASVQTTDTSETTLLAAGGAGVFHDLLHLSITNESGTATVVTLRDDTGAGTAYKFALAANGGIVLNWNTPFKAGAANDNWTVQSSAVVTLDHVVQAAKNV